MISGHVASPRLPLLVGVGVDRLNGASPTSLAELGVLRTAGSGTLLGEAVRA